MQSIAFYAAFFIGIAALGYGVYLAFFRTRGYTRTRAVIDHIDKIYKGTDSDGDPSYDYHVYVNYTVNGRNYSGQSDYYDFTYKEGKEIFVFVNPDDPQDIRGDTVRGAPLLMLIGAGLLVLAFVKLKGEM